MLLNCHSDPEKGISLALDDRHATSDQTLTETSGMAGAGGESTGSAAGPRKNGPLKQVTAQDAERSVGLWCVPTCVRMCFPHNMKRSIESWQFGFLPGTDSRSPSIAPWTPFWEGGVDATDPEGLLLGPCSAPLSQFRSQPAILSCLCSPCLATRGRRDVPTGCLPPPGPPGKITERSSARWIQP